MKKILLSAILFILSICNISAVSYTIFRRDTEILLTKKNASWIGDYSKLPNNFYDTNVEINNSELKIKIGGETFEFVEIPKEWNVGFSWRSVRYECIDLKTYGKVYIYLIEYDKTENCRLMLKWFDIDDKPVEIYNLKKK